MNQTECLSISILDDQEIEGQESFTLSLSSDLLRVDPTRNSTVVNIIDDEGNVEWTRSLGY